MLNHMESLYLGWIDASDVNGAYETFGYYQPCMSCYQSIIFPWTLG